MKAPAVLVNAGAGRARRDPGLIDRIQALVPAERVEVTRAIEQVAPALQRLRRAGAETLIVVGGDGSVTGTLTELLRVWPADALPRVVFAPGGTINTIAQSLGCREPPEVLIERLVQGSSGPAAAPRPILRIRSGEAAPRYGMIFANGAATRFLDAYHSGRPGSGGAASTVLRTLGSVLVNGRLARQTFRPFEARVEVDDTACEGLFTVMGAATVRHVGLGFAPFRTAGKFPDRFHWVSTRAGGLRLGSEIPALGLGFHSRASCLRHASPRRARVQIAEPIPYTIDGDLFPATKELELEAGPLIRLLAP